MTDHTWAVGDHVLVGHGKTHWIIEALDVDRPVPRARLISGLSGRHQYEVPLSTLTLHTPATPEGENS